MRKNKIITILLTFLLILNLGAVCAFADTEESVDESTSFVAEEDSESQLEVYENEALGKEEVIDQEKEELLEEILRAGRSRTVYMAFPCYYSPGFSDNEASVGLTGTFTVDVANGNIISARKPEVQLESFGHTPLHTMYLTDKRTSYTIIKGNKVKFMASFTLVSDDGIFTPMEWNFSIYMTCDAAGNVVDSSR